MEVDINKGLVANLTTRWRDFSFSQPLAYWGVPFQCTRCRKLGHIMCECPLKVNHGVRGINFNNPEISMGSIENEGHVDQGISSRDRVSLERIKK